MPVPRRRGPKRRRRDGELSEAVMHLLASGYWWEFLAGDGEARPDLRTEERLRKAHKAEVQAWNDAEFAGTALWGYMRPWERVGAPWSGGEVRPEWESGTWTYALGKPAIEHERYAEAVQAAQGRFDTWWIRTWQDVEAVLDGCWFDAYTAWRIVVFAERFCRHSKGQWAGKPFRLLDWQQYDMLMPILGWKGPDGYRRHNRGHIEIPKKNGKSTLSSVVALYLLVADGEPGAEVYSAAVDKRQARIVYDECEKIVKASPVLRQCLKITTSKKRIDYERHGAHLEALSADAETKEGLNIHGAIVDELHAHKNRNLFETLIFGGSARLQFLFLSITTAGKYDPTSIGYEQHTLARRVLEGGVKLHNFFAYIASAPKDEEFDWRDPEVHRRANPSYGVTVGVKFFEAQVRECSGNQTSINNFLRYRLNVWVQSVGAYLDLDAWLECADPVEEARLIGRPAYSGLDLSNTTDLACLAWAFPPHGDDPKWRTILRTWTPEEKVREKAKTGDVPYPAWVDEGWMVPTPGNSVDYEFIRARFLEDAKKFELHEAGYDPWNATQLATQLFGGDGMPMVEVRQGTKSMSEPTKRLRSLIKDHAIGHDGNPVLTWAVSSMVVAVDNNDNVKPDKASSTQKIDPVVALVIAMSRAIVHVAEKKKSRYEDEGAEIMRL